MTALALAACSSRIAPTTYAERALHDQFGSDRKRCYEVAERSLSYVDPKDGRAVAERSIKVEADVQRCMLSRGWNDPRHDGWKDGRS